MAGNYPDVPSWRIPYDRDGSVMVEIISSVPYQQAGSVLIALNNEGDDAPWDEGTYCIIFPRLMDIDGLFLCGYGPAGVGAHLDSMYWSNDTTNGVDGTWTVIAGTSWWTSTTSVTPTYRDEIWSNTIGGVRALKFGIYGGYGGGAGADVRAWHIYGEPTAGEDENRLEIWHPTLNQRVDPAYFDVGNVQRSSSEDITFRVKNRSTTLTANDVRISFEALTDTSPSVPGQYQVSSDGTNFYAQRTISAIAPGAISSVYTVRRVTPSDAVLSVWTLRMNVEATTGWS